MDRVSVGPVKGLKIAVAAFILSLILFITVLGAVLYLRSTSINEVQEFTEELRAGLIRNCEKNGNPLRIAVRELLQHEIQQSNIETIEQYFPQIPHAELEALINRQTREKQATIRKLHPLDCKMLYPKT